MEEEEGLDDSFLQEDSTIIDLEEESGDSDFDGLSGSPSETSQDNISDPTAVSLNTSQMSSAQSPPDSQNTSILSTESLNLQLEVSGSENLNLSQNASINTDVTNSQNSEQLTEESDLRSSQYTETFSQSTFTSEAFSSQNSEISSDCQTSRVHTSDRQEGKDGDTMIDQTQEDGGIIPLEDRHAKTGAKLECPSRSDCQDQGAGDAISVEDQQSKTGADAEIHRSGGQDQKHGVTDSVEYQHSKIGGTNEKIAALEEKKSKGNNQIEKKEGIDDLKIKENQAKEMKNNFGINTLSTDNDSDCDRLVLDYMTQSDSETGTEKMESNEPALSADKSIENDTRLSEDLSKCEKNVATVQSATISMDAQKSAQDAEGRFQAKEDNPNLKQTTELKVEDGENQNNHALSTVRKIQDENSPELKKLKTSANLTEANIPEFVEMETDESISANIDGHETKIEMDETISANIVAKEAPDNSDIGPIISLSGVQHITPEEFERMGKGDDESLKSNDRETTHLGSNDDEDDDIDPSEIQSVPVPMTRSSPVPVTNLPEIARNSELKVVFPVKIKPEPVDERYEAAMIPKTLPLVASQNSSKPDKVEGQMSNGGPSVVKTAQMTSQTTVTSSVMDSGSKSKVAYKMAIQKYPVQQQYRRLPVPERRPVRPKKPPIKMANNFPRIINLPMGHYVNSIRPPNPLVNKPIIIKQPNTKSFNVASITQLMQRKHKIGSHKAQPLPPEFKGYLLNYSPATCLECGDSFMSKDTMDMHTERVSLLIEYQCPLCKTICTFYNKCAFLGHIRCHNKAQAAAKNPAIQVKADILTINMPPRDKVLESLDRTFEPFQTIPIPENPILCHECDAGFVNMAALADHFGQQELVCSFNFVCYTCNMVLPKKCSFEAHKRYHSMKPPHTCPECGEVFSEFQEFREHIKNVCLHFSRSSFLQCNSLSGIDCGYKSVLLAPMVKHVKTGHIGVTSTFHDNETTFKLSVPVYLNQKHRRGDSIFHCKICEERGEKWVTKKVMNFPELHVASEHMVTHITEIKRNATFCYKCTECPERKEAVFSSKDYLITHMRENHQTKTWPLCCSACNDSFTSYPKMLSHQLRVHEHVNSEFYYCNVCKIMFENPDLFKKHVCEKSTVAVKSSEKMSEPKEKTNIVPKALRKISPKKSSMIKIALGPPPVKATPTAAPVQKPAPPPEKITCEICRIEFDTEAKFAEHNKTEHSSFPCHLCGLTYDSQQKLERHCQATHVGDKPGYICYPCKQKGIKRHFNTAIFLEKHLIFKHRIAKQRVQRFINIGRENRRKDATKRQLASDTEAETEQETLPVKRLRKEGSGLYACVKCSFSTEDSIEFCKHIENHKTVEANQCPECGLCFSVLPSLKKHLFMVHKIRNADEYIKEKGIKEPEELPPDSEDEELDKIDVEVSPRKKILKDIVPIETERKKEGPVGELECRVCYKEFENLNLLKNHMRVHGMAFIRSRRAPGNEVKVENDSP